MKKKLLSLILVAAMTVTLLTGCSLFVSNSGNDDATNSSEDSETSKFPAVKITDSFSFENPSDLDFDARFVLYFDENSSVVSTRVDNYGMQAYYVILYAKEDQPLARYEIYVCDTAENQAKWLAEGDYSTSGRVVEILKADATVMQSYSNAETLEADILLCQTVGLINEGTVSAYADFTISAGGTLMD